MILTLPCSVINFPEGSGQARCIIRVKEEVVGKASRADCFHIAVATLQKADLLVSWNFKHIVNIERIHGYNAVNLKNGFQPLEIRNPRKAFDYEAHN